MAPTEKQFADLLNEVKRLSDNLEKVLQQGTVQVSGRMSASSDLDLIMRSDDPLAGIQARNKMLRGKGRRTN